jgi:hypothetical protein
VHCWQRSFELIKMHGKTTVKKSVWAFWWVAGVCMSENSATA